ncbi:hypothetical protein JCM16358_20520 [Halanaerocella petrolearia]
MKFRLKTSKQTKEILKKLQSKSNLRPNILARIAINLSLTNETPVSEKDYDNDGLEFPRNVLLGEYDSLFRALLTQKIESHLEEEKYFPHYIKLHLERGSKMLEREYEYSGNFKTFVTNLTKNKLE